jgi:hypothetical protein
VRKVIGIVKSLVDWTGTAITVIGWLGLTAIITGFGTAVGGAIWAVIIGVPTPIAIMAGYCTLAGGICLALSPLAYRALSRIATSPVPPDTAAPEKPNAATWQHVPKFALYQAACLLADIIPVFRIPKGDAEAWYDTFRAEIRSKEIAYIPSIHDSRKTYPDGYHPDGNTEITRAEFQRFAERHDIRPRFLFPD